MILCDSISLKYPEQVETEGAENNRAELTNEYRTLFWGNKYILEQDKGDNCTTL